MIQISESAARHIKRLREEESSTSSAFLRVRVTRGGCSGFTYKMEFDSHVSDGDQKIESQGMSLIVDKESLLYLIGMTLDYEGGLNGQGFQFKNPNASKTCGCGTSFAV